MSVGSSQSKTVVISFLFIGTLCTDSSKRSNLEREQLTSEGIQADLPDMTDTMDSPVMMYGKMLAWDIIDVTQTDSDIKHIIKVAVDFVKKQNEENEVKSSELYQEHKIDDLKKYRLVYSDDDVTPRSLTTEQMTADCPSGKESKLAYMGFLYKFTLQLGKEKHRFKLSEFLPGETHIYSHTVQGTDQVTCPSQSEDTSSRVTEEAAHCGAGEPPSKKLCSTRNKLKVLTQNIWNFYNVEKTEEDYVRRMKLLGPLLQAVAADIIGFQEVRYQHGSGLALGPSQMAHLYQYLPDYQFVYQPAMTQHRSLIHGRCEEGLAIFSRFPILNHDFILLKRNKSDPEDGHQRICLHAEIDVPTFGQVHVFVSHLSLTDKARQTSVVEIWEYMHQFDGPAVFMGDLNAEPYEDSIKYLNGEVELEGSRVSGLVDTWLVSNTEAQSGLTFDTLKAEAHKRIDYVYMRKSDDLAVDDVQLISTGNHGSGAASDHYGVLTTFSTTKS